MSKNYSLTKGEQKEIIQYIDGELPPEQMPKWLYDLVTEIAVLRRQVEAGKMLAKVLRQVDPYTEEDGIFCEFCNKIIFDDHAPDCPWKLAWASWDEVMKEVQE